MELPSLTPSPYWQQEWAHHLAAEWERLLVSIGHKYQ